MRGVWDGIQDSRSIRPRPGTDKARALDLVHAIRGEMSRYGYAPINPYATDEYERAQAEYRREYDIEPPVFATSKLRLRGRWYLWDGVRVHLRAALELHRTEPDRSAQAVSLSELLYRHHLDDAIPQNLAAATPALLDILEQIKPI